jgi:hypothetical protein
VRTAPIVAAAATVAVVASAGCSVGRPTGFAARSNDTCATATKTIAALRDPHDATSALAYALDRSTAVERAVSTLTDSSLPGGQAGQDLRERWLRPARSSLRAGDDDLVRLRDATRRHDVAGAVTAFGSAAAAGTSGVDTELLRSRGLTKCAGLFTPRTPPGFR